MADVTGSAFLIWRFLAGRRDAAHAGPAEARAAPVVVAALALVSIMLIVESASALAAGSRPGSSALALVSAGVTLVVLAPLGYAKRRLGGPVASHALQGDGALSAAGAAISLLALTGLLLYRTLGWWADRAAALIVAVLAAAEACRIAWRVT